MSLFSRILYGVLVGLTLAIAGYAAQYWILPFLGGAGPLENNFGPTLLAVHAFSGSVALILGPFQFLPGLRAKRPRLHHLTGRFYVAGCLVGGASGLALAIGSTSGPVVSLGFGLMAIAWLFVTTGAVYAAMRRNIKAHRAGMVRSYALTMAAIALRFELPGMMIGGVDPILAYEIVAWSCWLPNLILAEIWLLTRRHPAPLAAA
jgi:uncharacterized membrane protein